jgi:hypothetical protein
VTNTGRNSKAAAGAKGSGAVKWLMAAIVLVSVAVIVMNLPRGYSDDLSRIGKGKAALVLVRDKNAVQSFDLLDVMNGLRDQYDGQVEFLLTDFNTPEGRAFMEQKGAARATLVVLDASGTGAKVLYPPQTKESVQQALAAVQVKVQ